MITINDNDEMKVSVNPRYIVAISKVGSRYIVTTVDGGSFHASKGGVKELLAAMEKLESAPAMPV